MLGCNSQEGKYDEMMSQAHTSYQPYQKADSSQYFSLIWQVNFLKNQ